MTSEWGNNRICLTVIPRILPIPSFFLYHKVTATKKKRFILQLSIENHSIFRGFELSYLNGCFFPWFCCNFLLLMDYRTCAFWDASDGTLGNFLPSFRLWYKIQFKYPLMDWVACLSHWNRVNFDNSLEPVSKRYLEAAVDNLSAGKTKQCDRTILSFRISDSVVLLNASQYLLYFSVPIRNWSTVLITSLHIWISRCALCDESLNIDRFTKNKRTHCVIAVMN